MRAPSFPSPPHSPILVVPFLGRRDLAIDAVKRPARPYNHADDGEQPVGTDAVIDPLSDVQEQDDCKRELDPDPGEIGAGETLGGALLRPFLVIHSAMKLTACEEFHKRMDDSV